MGLLVEAIADDDRLTVYAAGNIYIALDTDGRLSSLWLAVPNACPMNAADITESDLAVIGNRVNGKNTCSACGGLGHQARTCGRPAHLPQLRPTGGPYVCSLCKKPGHNKRTCPNASNT